MGGRRQSARHVWLGPALALALWGGPGRADEPAPPPEPAPNPTADEVLAIGHDDARVRLWNANGWRDPLYVGDVPNALTWDPLGGRVAVSDGRTAAAPGGIALYDVARETHDATIPVAEVVAWSPDGEHVAVGSVAGRFAIYRVRYAE